MDAPLVGWSRFPLFVGLPRSLARSVSGRNALFPVAAVGLTALLIASGVDSSARDFTTAHCPLDTFEQRIACLYIGMLWPVIVGLVLLRRGFFGRHRERAAAGAAVIQTIVVVGLLTLLLKLATGRPPPRIGTDSNEFNWLAFDHGPRLLVMWPSGHTSESVSAAACLQAFYGRSRTIAVAWIAAALVVASMFFGCFHWVSDLVAGALLAYPIGRAIGETFRAWAGIAVSRPQDQSAGSSLPSSRSG